MRNTTAVAMRVVGSSMTAAAVVFSWLKIPVSGTGIAERSKVVETTAPWLRVTAMVCSPIDSDSMYASVN